MEDLESIDLANGVGDLDHERKLKQLGGEIARVAHELNTPVSLIAGSLGNLDEQVGALLHYVSVSRAYTAEHPELARAYEESRIDYILTNSTNLLAICDEGVQRLRYIAGQLRGYGRRAQASCDQCSDVAGTLRRAERMARSAHPGAPPVRWALADDLQVAGDEQTLLPALVNVIGNAFDAVTGRPAPRVSIAARAIDEARAEIRVLDNGPGVAPAVRDQVFTPFFTTKRPGTGVGLGLAIARDAIEHVGGTIALGVPKDGAEFVIHLPLA